MRLKTIFLWSICITLASTSNLFAQLNLSSNPAQFPEDVVAMMKSTKNDEAIKVGEDFMKVWNSSKISSANQAKIISLAQKMLKKRLKSRPYFENFFAAINFAINNEKISETGLNNYLNVTDKFFEKSDPRKTATYLSRTREFFEKRTFYFSNYNTVMVIGGKYSFVLADENKAQPTETKDPEIDTDWFTDFETNKEDDWNLEEVTENETQKENELLKLKTIKMPDIEGVTINVADVDLVFKTSYDSVSIQNTSGSLILLDNIFVGNGGKFDWAIAGLDPSQVYVKLEKYTFSVNKAYILAEHVMLTNTTRLTKPVIGVFEFHSVKHTSTDDTSYPRFKSYKSNVEVKGIGDDIFYKGGFSMYGNKILSSSVLNNVSIIKVEKQGKLRFKTMSKVFNLQDSVISSEKAAIMIYHGQDSIFHPGVRLRYNKLNHQLTALRDVKGYGETPLESSYFDMDITADILKWNVNSDSLNISILNARAQRPAFFESHDYFSGKRYNDMTGLYPFHPLAMVIQYARRKKTKVFYADDLARELRQSPSTVRGAMDYLMKNGFISYKSDDGRVKLKDKSLHYYLSNGNKKDYDNLIIPSIEEKKPNATFYLDKRAIRIRGIKNFTISEKLNVFIQPENNEITLLKGRDFRFNGNVFSGNFEFIGKQFEFKYDSFLIDLKAIDSIRLYVNVDGEGKLIKKIENPRERTGKRVMLANAIEQSSGTLYINKPSNKSSKEDFPKYPIFNSLEGGTVFFDGPEINEGAYDRTIAFAIPPFEIDSLSSSNPAAINFSGTFKTNGVVPDFKEKLRVMPDLSLGFEHQAPDAGYRVYQSDSRFFKQLALDNRGLTGNGTINHLSATLRSEQFVFYMDSLKGKGTSALIKEGLLNGADYPQLYVENYTTKWFPKKDTLLISNDSIPISMYNQVATLDGTAILTSKSLYGTGELRAKGSITKSDNYTLAQKSFTARNALLNIESEGASNPIFKGTDVKFVFDLQNDKGQISPENEGVAALEFPYAQFKTSISEATWDLSTKEIAMVKPANTNINKSYFYTTRQELDSLAFNGEKALYKIDELNLNVYGVPFVKVADAKIIPDNNEVKIGENSSIQPFVNATLFIDTLNQNHTLVNGNIGIISRDKFVGHATYRLVNALSDTFNIKFGEFATIEEVTDDKQVIKHTVASGEIAEEDQMVISPGMFFKGKATMYAHKPALELEGLVKLDLKNIPDYNTWIKYKSDANNREIEFNFNQSVTENGEPLIAGLHYEAETNELYSTFVSEKKSLDDQDFFMPSGILAYDHVRNEYKIATKEKAAGKAYDGKIFTYNENTSDVTFEGAIKLIDTQKDKDVNFATAAKGKGNFNSNEYNIDAFIVLDFELPSQALSLMASEIQDLSLRLGFPKANKGHAATLYRIAEIAGEKVAKNYKERSLSEYTPLPAISNDFNKTLVFSDVNLQWSNEHRAWFSKGKLGLSNILREDINADLDGFLEIRKTDEGDKIDIFIKVSAGSWYYFSYANNRLITASSNLGFENEIKDKSKVGKTKPGQYVFTTTDIAEALGFVDGFRKDYYNITTPYELSVPDKTTDDTDDFKTIEDVEEENNNETEDNDGF